MKVVITGATKGMGYAIATEFAGAGFDIIANARTEKDLEAMAANFESRFPEILVITKAADLESEEQVKSFGAWLIESGNTPDVLINNAGYFVPGKIHSEDEGMLQKMMQVNVYSAYHLSRAVLPAMMQKKNGHIFNICSVASFAPLPNVGSYGISKFALLGLTRHLREEMKTFRIKVTAVLPGATMTASWDGADIDPERIMAASDVAKMILASTQLSPMAVVEDIVLRPQLGDL